MKIAYNPKTAAALTSAPANNDITFDLSGLSIYVKGIRFKGTDTTYTVFKKHNSGDSGGYNGLVPVPNYNGNSLTRYLREDGTWLYVTDELVKLSETTTADFRPVVLGLTHSATLTELVNPVTGQVYVTSKIYACPSTGVLYATKLYSNGKEVLTEHQSLANYVTLSTDQEITSVKTFTKQLKFTVAKGTAPFLVTSDTKVTNLNSDLLDGKHLDDVQKLGLRFSTITKNDGNYRNPDLLEGGMITNYNDPADWKNAPINMLYGSIFAMMPHYTNQLSGLFAWDTTNSLWFRMTNGTTWKPWRTVVFTDSNITGNAASADKLKTKRKLWGLDFDGTADVSGNMTGVGSITMTDNITIQGTNLDRFLNFYHDFNNPVLSWRIGYIGTGYGNNNLLSFESSGANSIWKSALYIYNETRDAVFTASVAARTFKGNLDGAYVNKLTNYSKATAAANLATTDTLNTALGKLEYKLDVAYNLVTKANDSDGTIENLKEILDVLAGIKDTETIKAIIGKYLPLAGGTMTGVVTFTSGSDSAYEKTAISFIKNGTTIEQARIGTSLTNDLGLYASGNIYLRPTSSFSSSSIGLIIYSNNLTYNGNNILHAGNSNIKNGVITINGTSITPLTEHQSLANYVTLNTTLTINGIKTFSMQLKFTVAQGTSPFTVTSTTKITNLNADLLDGIHESSFYRHRGSYGKSYTAASTDYNLGPGTYITSESGYSGTLLSFNSTGSASAIQFWTHYIQGNLYYRTSVDSNRWGKTDGAWTKILDSDNYTNYTVTKTGNGASGTWGININGNAATASVLYTRYIEATQSAIAYYKLSGILKTPITTTIFRITSRNSESYLLYVCKSDSEYTIPRITIERKQYSKVVGFSWSGNDLYIKVAPYSNGIYITQITGNIINYTYTTTDAATFNSATAITMDECAFLTSNVASATKFQTPRTIWGQSFDGTANVSGALTGVSGITFVNNGTTYNGWGNPRMGENAGDWTVYSYSGSVYLMVTKIGNVGIGTGSPSYKLHVDGTTYSHGGFVKGSSSDSYVLLGGGGHKAMSDFMLKTDELSNNLTTISKSLTVTLAWMDTGIKYTDLATGTYIVLLTTSGTNIGQNASLWDTIWSGVMSWYGSDTNCDGAADEIILHRSGHAYSNTLYLRTITTPRSDGRHLRLLIAANRDLGAAYTYTFKFKRII